MKTDTKLKGPAPLAPTTHNQKKRLQSKNSKIQLSENETAADCNGDWLDINPRHACDIPDVEKTARG